MMLHRERFLNRRKTVRKTLSTETKKKNQHSLKGSIMLLVVSRCRPHKNQYSRHRRTFEPVEPKTKKTIKKEHPIWQVVEVMLVNVFCVCFSRKRRAAACEFLWLGCLGAGLEVCKLTQTCTADTAGCCGTPENLKQLVWGVSVHYCCFHSTKTIILFLPVTLTMPSFVFLLNLQFLLCFCIILLCFIGCVNYCFFIFFFFKDWLNSWFLFAE